MLAVESKDDPTQHLAECLLSNYGLNVSLQRHLARGLDANAQMVHMPCHSTAGEAGRIAAAARARALALFHLPGRRYVDYEEILAEARRFAPDTDVFIAEDNQTLEL